MTFETISEKPFTKQELLNRKLHLTNAKLSASSDMANIFSMFSIYAVVDLNISPGDASSELLTLFMITTSLLVVCTVLVKMAIMYVTPTLETALFMARYDITEFDQLSHDDVIKYMELVWVLSTLGSCFLFGLNFICMSWIKYQNLSTASVISATSIMTPVLIISIAFAAFAYLRIKKRNEKCLLNEEEIGSGSPKVHYYSKRVQTNNNNSHVVGSRWDLVRAHVYNGRTDGNNSGKSHIV